MGETGLRERFLAPDVVLESRARARAAAATAHRLPAVKIVDIYGRVSRIYNTEFVSVPVQVEEARDWFDNELEDAGWQLGEAFQNDAGIGATAAAKRKVRHDFERLMGRLERGESHGFMTYDLSRFTRRPDEGYRLLQIIESRPYIRIFVVSSQETRRLDSAEGRAAFQQQIITAECESAKAVERYTLGRRIKARQGRLRNRVSPGFGLPGYMPPPSPRPAHFDPARDLVPYPAERVQAEQDAIRWAVSAILDDGRYLTYVANEWNARGITTRTGCTWTLDAVRLTLSRPALAGYTVHQGQIMGTVCNGEPVVDRERWARLMAVFTARSSGRTHERSLLGAGLVTCGRCGGTLRRMTKGRTGEAVPYYQCMPRTVGGRQVGCSRNGVPVAWLDALVSAAARARLGEPETAARLAAARGVDTAGGEVAQLERDVELARLRGELAEAEETLSMLVTKVAMGSANGGMDRQRYEAALPMVEARIARARRQIEAAEPTEDERQLAGIADVAAAWRTAEAAGDVRALQALIRVAFPRLTVVPNAWDGARGRGSRPARVWWDGITDAQRAGFLAAERDARVA